MPRAPDRGGVARDDHIRGLSILKSLTGGDSITIERKGRDLIVARVQASVWGDSNFNLDFVQGIDDAKAWMDRLVILPFNEHVMAEDRIEHYEERFQPELSAIAYHAVAAYDEARERGTITWSTEMIEAQAALVDGKLNGLERFLQSLEACPGGQISRRELKRAAEETLGRAVNRKEVREIFNHARGISGVEEGGREGRIFYGLGLNGGVQ